MNLSLENLHDERWEPIPGFEDRFVVSDKGRVKRLSSWTTNGRTIFLKEQILYQIMEVKNNTTHLYCLLNHREKTTRVTITRLLYYCFVEKFDMNDKSFAVINQNDPFWNIDISKLSLSSFSSLLKGKMKRRKARNL